MFRRLVATSRAPQIMVLSMLRSFGKIGPQIDQIWAWLSRGHRWSPGVRNPLKSLNTGLSLLVNCYLEIKFHKIIRVNPPPLRKKINERQRLKNEKSRKKTITNFFLLFNTYFTSVVPTALLLQCNWPITGIRRVL